MKVTQVVALLVTLLQLHLQVYLPAIEGYVPQDMVQMLQAFLEFCYYAQRDVLDDCALNKLKDAIDRFHKYRDIFLTTGIRQDFNLPRQHSLKHYYHLIRLFTHSPKWSLFVNN
jgi:hypothetical protein